MSFVTGAVKVAGWRAAVESEIAQQVNAAQQLSESTARGASECAQQRGAGSALGGQRIAAPTASTRATLPNMLNL
jgi:hypothetical protein